MTSPEIVPRKNIFPTIKPDGQVQAPSAVFAKARLSNEELVGLTEFTNNLRGTGNTATEQWDYATEELLEELPWLGPWTETVDDFVAKNGQKLDPPIAIGTGFRVIVFDDRASEDHTDNFWQRPAALSIGLEGERKLVGVRAVDMDSAMRNVRQLGEYSTRLAQLSQVDLRPVMRITQKPGDVVTIGNYETIHSGSPVPGTNNVAIAIARQNIPAPGSEDIAAAHLARYYPPGYMIK